MKYIELEIISKHYIVCSLLYFILCINIYIYSIGLYIYIYIYSIGLYRTYISYFNI